VKGKGALLMTTLFVLGLMLIAIFGFAVSAYLTFYSFNINNWLAKSLLFLVLGVVVSLATFTVSLIIVWPGAM
jgi:hypothetical protein